MLKSYLIASYAYLVKTGIYSLDKKESKDNVVPEEYKQAVAEYLLVN